MAAPTTSTPPDRASGFADRYRALHANVEQVIQGKGDTIDLAITCLVAGGHLLLEDVPGVGKTSLAKALARSIDVSFGRIQFTPDLLPADVIGVNVWDRNGSQFRFRAGPVFNQIVLADEINRASPKTQSALLEAMAEHQVTVDGETHGLQAPFLVIATQNPIENEGTYVLPESQLDRFLMRISMGYPDRGSELDILGDDGGEDALDHLNPVFGSQTIAHLAAEARSIHVASELAGYLVDLAHATRRHPDLMVGMSPRATLALQRAARARAATRGRGYVIPDDIKALVHPVIAHRLLLTPHALASGTDPGDILAEVVESVALPTRRATDTRH